MSLQSVKKNVTHTHTSDNGAVFVIRDVPAIVLHDSSGSEQIKYKPRASRVIMEYLRSTVPLFTEPGVYSVSYDEASEGIYIDAQIRFAGSQVRYDRSTIKVWQDATRSIYRSWTLIEKACRTIGEFSPIFTPIVHSVTPGSLIFGLRAEPKEQQTNLFVEDEMTAEIQILQILMDAHDLVMKSKTENELIMNFPPIRMAAIEAVKALSPNRNSSIEEVQILPRNESFKKKELVSFTKDTGSKAKDLKKKLDDDPEKDDKRIVWIVGKIERLSYLGKMKIRDIKMNLPEDKHYHTSALFVADIFHELTDFFKYKKRVLLKGEEFRYNGEWSSEPIIKSVELAPDIENVDEIREDYTKLYTKS